MKKVFLITLVFLFCLSISSVAYAEVNFNFGLIPAGIMISPDAEDFKARRSNALSSTTEQIAGNGLYAPGAFIGLDFDSYIQIGYRFRSLRQLYMVWRCYWECWGT